MKLWFASGLVFMGALALLASNTPIEDPTCKLCGREKKSCTCIDLGEHSDVGGPAPKAIPKIQADEASPDEEEYRFGSADDDEDEDEEEDD